MRNNVSGVAVATVVLGLAGAGTSAQAAETGKFQVKLTWRF